MEKSLEKIILNPRLIEIVRSKRAKGMRKLEKLQNVLGYVDIVRMIEVRCKL